MPLANNGLNIIPNSVTDEQALLVGDVLATGFWAAHISEKCQNHYFKHHKSSSVQFLLIQTIMTLCHTQFLIDGLGGGIVFINI